MPQMAYLFNIFNTADGVQIIDLLASEGADLLHSTLATIWCEALEQASHPELALKLSMPSPQA